MKPHIIKLQLLSLCLMLLAACSGNGGDTVLPRATGPDDLKGYNVAVLAGSYSDLEFEKIAPGAIKQIYNAEADMFAALDNDRSQFIMIDSIVTIGIDKKLHPIEAAYSEPLLSGNVGTAFRKTDAALCSRFNEFLAEIKADGTYDAMRDRWVSDKLNVSEMPEIEQFTKGEPIEVGSIVQLPCCFTRDGEWVGFEVELMKRFAAYMQRPLKLEMYDFSALMAGLKTGVIDIWCAFVTITEERSKEVLFSDPYFFSPVTVFQKAETQIEKVPLPTRIVNSFKNNMLVDNRWKLIVDGLWETVIISILALLFGTLLGGLICLLRKSRNSFLSGFAKVYVEILRGVPMLVFLMVMFYVVLSSSGLTGRWVAVISFAINFSAYACEIFRTGIDSVDRGQTEAGLAMGFTRIGTFFNFVLPQALKNILPVFKNEAISLIKGTSIVGYVAIQDLTKASDIIRARTFDAFFPLIIITIIYFLLAWLFGKALDRLGKKIS